MNLLAPSARLPGGWADNVLLSISPEGRFERVEPNAADEAAERLCGQVLPAMPNCHSHAFQRAMAGTAEYRRASVDNFWSWRSSMYEVAQRMTADTLYAVAFRLFVEMLKAGYSTVTEFHYLHRTAGGGDDILASSIRPLQRAARDAGIRLLMLPVLYQRGGFDNRPLNAAQQQFFLSTQAYCELLEQLTEEQSDRFRLGMAIHSLRAVDEDTIHTVLSRFEAVCPAGPIHIHIAEQDSEVQDCVRYTGSRPIERLLDQFGVDDCWCLIHATHVTPDELERLSKTEASIGLCPTTEANLGDGIFPTGDWLALGGRIAIGSDSNVSISPCEELRWLEYAQRLQKQQRTVLSSDAHPHVGDRLWQAAICGGARATGAERSGIQVGAPADLIVLDAAHPMAYGRKNEAATDAFVFAGNDNLVRDVMVAGRWSVRARSHAQEASSRELYKVAIDELSNGEQ